MAEQLDWINGQGGLDGVVARTTDSSERALRLGREDVVHHAVRRRPGPALAGDRHHRLRRVDRRRRGAPRPCAPTASSTPSPTASSAATSSASRCSRPSTRPTSRPSPPASTTSSSSSTREGLQVPVSADRFPATAPVSAQATHPRSAELEGGLDQVVGRVVEGDEARLLDLGRGRRAGCRPPRPRRRPWASRRCRRETSGKATGPRAELVGHPRARWRSRRPAATGRARRR